MFASIVIDKELLEREIKEVARGLREVGNYDSKKIKGLRHRMSNLQPAELSHNLYTSLAPRSNAALTSTK